MPSLGVTTISMGSPFKSSQNTYKLIPHSGKNFFVCASEPFNLPQVALVFVQLGHRLGNVVLGHDSLVKLKRKWYTLKMAPGVCQKLCFCKLGQFHKALSTDFGAWNTNLGAPSTKIGALNTNIPFSIS